MNPQHLRYFATALVASFVAAVAVGGLIISLSSAAAGAALIAGWWTNLAAAGTVAIMGARKVAREYTDPRLGKVAGTAMGIWAGIGAALGMLGYAYFVVNVYKGDVKIGLVIIFMVVSLIVSVIAGAIAGRETAQPPEEEEI